MKLNRITLVISVFLAIAANKTVMAQADKFDKEYSPYQGMSTPINVYFGDTHLHTSWSTDSGMAGATLTPDDAYRFAMGETVTSNLGWKAQLRRPLDFIVVADHAENLGLADFIRREDPILMKNEQGRKWVEMTKAGKGYDAFIEWLRAEDNDLIDDPKMVKAAWDLVTTNADKYNRPGSFTAFHGFEWTSHPNGNNMHRVVIFRDDKNKTNRVLPYSQFDSVDAEDLWKYMQTYEDKTGGKVLAIPHNGNLSNGYMFDTKTLSGDPLTEAYARTRMKWEPIVEVTQQKGDGETHPFLSPDDAFADFETMDAGNISGKVPKTNDMLPGEYARSALKEGLKQEAELGSNPFKFGMVGSTDNHTGLATTREDNNFGKAHFVEPDPHRIEHVLIEGAKPELSLYAKDLGASGLAAVWARENTREAIWDSMARKEVYATSGSRLKVRLFAGWDFQESDLSREDFAIHGYANGVPMGGDLTAAPSGKSPTLLVQAMKDQDGANLDRIQIIKGWLDKDGTTHERVYDVAVSDGRTIDKDGICKEPVGNTVNVKDATYTNDIGAVAQQAYWQDPDFDSNEKAFYYVRVIEIPKPRWTAYDAKFFNLKLADDVKMIVQDRAYTSPVWYTPE
ncbi:DUF3604 domain-containing protein [Thalassotalea mangrovi]|uniref:DUF3604 domain-containing protein n=1 Tax=Thalassotalea mangrovi TaxID=2572245 RepID=A0A4U1B5N3_9GAMM|nr:DUF3604 domain-containing protein [Thalassotalea mangrovi]TKB45121.1 DUF3604 domain-containing protein [Thalassotalea mangrovi]